MKRLAIIAAIVAVVAPASVAASATLPTWSTAILDPVTKQTSTLIFVGSDPSLGGSSLVPTQLVGFNFKFPNGVTLGTKNILSRVVASPILSPATSPVNGDYTQYGDMIQRAEFGKVGTTYHTLLGLPSIQFLNVTVPAGYGTADRNSRGVLVGKVDVNWLDNFIQLHLGRVGATTGSLPIFISNNVMGYENDPTNCCIIGYHSAVKVSSNTYIYAAYVTPGTFKDNGMADVDALSHEVSEWFNDPYTNNTVGSWKSPLAPQYGCSNWFETGDPLVGVSFAIAGNNPVGGAWHLQDEAFLNWFVHDGEAPALAPAAGYTYLNTFASAAPAC